MKELSFKKEDFSKGDYVSKFLLAAYEGNMDFMEFCLLQGFSPNLVNEKGITPLMVASWKGRENIVRYLLNKKADVVVEDNDGNTALDYAEAGGHENIIFLIKANIPEE